MSRLTGDGRCECGHLAKWHYVQPTGIITEERGCSGSTPNGKRRCRCPGFTRKVEDDREALLSRLAVVEAERDELRAKVEAVKELITEGAGMAHRCFAAVRHFDERDLRRALSGTTEGPS